jgi:4'-phosphopantetheinyl transferase
MKTGSNETDLSSARAAIYVVACGEDIGDRDFMDAEALLDEGERVRAQQFRFEADRRDYIAAHALLRTTLSLFVKVPPKRWHFTADAFGKPTIAEPDVAGWLAFSLSHTRALATCAVTSGVPVGVDVECIRQLDDTLDLARRFFSSSEARSLEQIAPKLRENRFFDLWTLKESYIKARGLGLSLPLNKFSFALAADGSIRFAVDPEFGDDADAWQFALHSPTPSHRLAYALRTGTRLKVRVTVAMRTLAEVLMPFSGRA